MDDLQMKAHIMSSMSRGYDTVVVNFRGELADTSLDKLQKEVCLQYKWLQKNGKQASESVMTANTNKKPWMKFKGTCHKCGVIGHKSGNCPTNRSGTSNGTRDILTVTCHKCKQKGHYANKCPNRQTSTTPTPPLLAMFVGVCSVDDPKDNYAHGFDDFFDDSCPDFGNNRQYKEEKDEDLLELPDGFLTEEQDFDTNMSEKLYVNETETDLVFLVDTEDEVVMSGTIEDQEESWLLDSGATCGVTHDDTWMTEMRKSGRQITIGNGDQIPTLGQGTVTLCSNCGTVMKIRDVYYAPEFAKNILSLRTLMDDDWILSGATKQALSLSRGNQTVPFKNNSRDNLYYLSVTRIKTTQDTVNSVTHKKTIRLDINVAHNILGHPDARMVKVMAGLQGWTLTDTLLPCRSCALAKARAKAVPKSTMTRARHPGKRLFLDISGPFPTSLLSNRYWFKIVDDHSRYSWDAFLPVKSGLDVPLRSLLLKNKAANKPCKFLRCDNAGENMKHVRDVCTKLNITMEMTAPHCPQQNEVVERSFATCRDRAYASMYCAKFSLETQNTLWPYAVNYVTRLTNCLPRRGMDKTPFKLWFGNETPAARFLQFLQPFRRVAFTTKGHSQRTKTGPKAVKCVFIGYPEDHTGDTYLFYNPHTRKTHM